MGKAIVIFSVIAIILLPIFSQENTDSSFVDHVEEQADGSSMNWTTQVMRVTGNGFGPESVKSLGRRKILAKRAARLDAMRNILEAVKGVQVTSNTSVNDMMLENDQISAGARGMVKGMRVTNVTYSDDGGCEMVVEINIGEGGSFLLSALNDSKIELKDNYPKFDWIALQKELKKTKVDLYSTRKTLSKTQANLASTKNTLQQKNNELREVKAEYALLKDDLTKTRNDLITANQNLIRSEEKLNYATLQKKDVEALLDVAQKELYKTKDTVDYLTKSLNTQKTDNAVKNKELELVKLFLLHKETELLGLDNQLKKYRNDYQNAVIDGAVLKGYIQRIKDTQTETGQKLDTLYTYTSKTVTVSYSGLLIDARNLGLKPVLAPAILSEREEKIYGMGVLPKRVNGGAIVDYVSGSIEKVQQYKKIGPNPLIIKGIKAVNQSDIMISNADTQKLASMIQLLENQKVAVLL